MRLKTQEEIHELRRAQKYGVVRCGGAFFHVSDIPVEDVRINPHTGAMHVLYNGVGDYDAEPVTVGPVEGLIGTS